MKPEILRKLNSPSKLEKIDSSKPENHLMQNLFIIERNAQKIKNKSRKNDPTIQSFLQEALEAYMAIIYLRSYQ